MPPDILTLLCFSEVKGLVDVFMAHINIFCLSSVNSFTNSSNVESQLKTSCLHVVFYTSYVNLTYLIIFISCIFYRYESISTSYSEKT